MTGLCAHMNHCKAQWLDAVRCAASKMLGALAEYTQGELKGAVSVDVVVILAAQVNSNAYAISDMSCTGRRGGNIGFGLFPFAAMLNHACSPNCAFAGAPGGTLTIRAIRPIAAGEVR